MPDDDRADWRVLVGMLLLLALLCAAALAMVVLVSGPMARL